MTDKAFVDTNILVYAHEARDTPKQPAAAACLEQLTRSRSGAISTQVLQEFYVTATRKVKPPLSPSEARAIIRDFSTWRTVTIDPSMVLAASELEERHQLAFWDALILAAAIRCGADLLYSEDFGHGRVLDGVRIVNPFA